MNLYHVTKFSLNLSFTVHYKYTEISRFTPVFIHKNSFELFLIGSFSILRIYQREYDVCPKRNRALSIPADPTISEDLRSLEQGTVNVTLNIPNKT